MAAGPGELAREAELSRARLDVAIDRLESRLTPLGLLDEAVGVARRSASAPIMRAVTESARRNPLAVLLIAAGVGLLVRELAGRHDEAPMAATNGSTQGETR